MCSCGVSRFEGGSFLLSGSMLVAGTAIASESLLVAGSVVLVATPVFGSLVPGVADSGLVAVGC